MGKKYMHCGNCWNVLGEISASDSERIFDTIDCSWSCECGRLNLSSDGLIEKYDSRRDLHYIYIRGNEEESLVEKIPDGFDRNNFKQELFSKLTNL